MVPGVSPSFFCFPLRQVCSRRKTYRRRLTKDEAGSPYTTVPCATVPCTDSNQRAAHRLRESNVGPQAAAPPREENKPRDAGAHAARPDAAPEQALPRTAPGPGPRRRTSSTRYLPAARTRRRAARSASSRTARRTLAARRRAGAARGGLRREAGQVGGVEQQQAQLRRWGLRRLRRPFAELAAAGRRARPGRRGVGGRERAARARRRGRGVARGDCCQAGSRPASPAGAARRAR